MNQVVGGAGGSCPERAASAADAAQSDADSRARRGQVW